MLILSLASVEELDKEMLGAGGQAIVGVAVGGGGVLVGGTGVLVGGGVGVLVGGILVGIGVGGTGVEVGQGAVLPLSNPPLEPDPSAARQVTVYVKLWPQPRPVSTVLRTH